MPSALQHPGWSDDPSPPALSPADRPARQDESGQPGPVLSTDVIRAELFGDAGVQGPWDEIHNLLLHRLQLSRPVEWIGWWLTTPLAQCKAWAQGRERPVPEAVIEEFHASINHRFFRPDRAEGFATIVALNPAAGEGTSDDDLRARLLQICNPPPQGDLASWQEVHGGNSDIDADAAASGVNGGHPALADRQALRRVFTLLRQILKEPFDAADGDGETAPPASAPASSGSAPARPKRARRSSDEFSPLYRHLIDRLSPIEGACAAKQEAVLRHDIEHLLGPMASSPK